MFRPILLAFLALFMTTPALADAVSITLSTGRDASNNIITSGNVNDGHWKINGVAAKTVASGNADWYGFWAANDSGSAWIARDPSTHSNGVGTYSMTFDLTGVDLSTVVMAGHWALDDEGTLSINGHQIDYQPNNGWQTWPARTFNVTNAGGWFDQGTNTLVLDITAADGFGGFFEGVRLDGALTGQTVPEPASAFLVTLGATVLLMQRRVR